MKFLSLTLAILLTAVVAQAAENLQPAPGRQIPQTIPNADSFPGLSDLLAQYPQSDLSGPLRVLIAYREAPLRAAPAVNSPTLLQSAAKFLQDYLGNPGEMPLTVLDQHEADGRRWWLLAEPSLITGRAIRKHLGWVPAEYCVPYVGDSLEGLIAPENKLHRKAMLRNVLTSAKNTQDLLSPIPFLDRPLETGRALETRALFRIYYIYGETATHFLLGLNSRCPPEAASSQLLGWVAREKVCRWNTREAIEFNKRDIEDRAIPARIFGSQTDLKAYLDGKQVEPVGEEDLQIKQWKPFQTRYPLLSDEDARFQGTPYKGTRIYKIGVIGDIYGPGNQRIQGRTVEDLREEARKFRVRASLIQICFLVDATYSMDRWFPVASQAIRDIASQSLNLGNKAANIQPRVEFTVNFYRDQVDGELRFEHNPFSDNASDAIRLLTNQRALGGGPSGNYEEVFHGISQSLKQTPFAEDAVKILVIIGDEGNNPQDQTYSVDSVSAELIKAGGEFPVGLFAIAVGGATSRESKQFVQQMEAISRKLSAHQVETLKKSLDVQGLPEEQQAALNQAIQNLVGETLPSREPKQVAERINKRFQLAVEEMQYRTKVLADLQDGVIRLEQLQGAARPAQPETQPEAPSAEGAYGLIWKQQMQNLIHENGLDPLELARSGVQLFHEGWIAEKDLFESAPAEGEPVPPAIQHMLYMEQRDLRRLQMVLHDVVRYWNPKSLEKSWKDALNSITGGEVLISEDQSPSELADLHLGVQVRDEMMALTFKELAELPPEKALAWKFKLRMKSELIEDVLFNQQADYVKVVNEEDGHSVVNWKRTNVRNLPPESSYWFSDDGVGSGPETQAWIPREIIP